MKKTVCLLLAMMLFMACVPAACADAALDLDFFAVVKFTSNHAVYSGPGEDYYRANNSKALLGAGGECRFYGYKGSWMMVGYQLTSGDYRIGWIPKSSVNDMIFIRKKGVATLRFDMTTRYLSEDCDFTDDPVINMKSITTLQKGTSITLLAECGEWCYIETTVSHKLARGFVESVYVTSSADAVSSATKGSASAPSGTNSGTSSQMPVNNSANPSNYILPSYTRATLGANYAIYTGPSEYYYRAADGIAYVGRKNECRIYGTDGDWLMVGYQTSTGAYRYGYVSSTALPAGVSVSGLSYAMRSCTVSSAVKLTEDPVTNKATLCELSSGTSAIFLAYLDSSREWALIEVGRSSAGLVRGFVRSGYIRFD